MTSDCRGRGEQAWRTLGEHLIPEEAAWAGPDIFTENGVWQTDSQLCKKSQGDEARFALTISSPRGAGHGINEL